MRKNLDFDATELQHTFLISYSETEYYLRIFSHQNFKYL